MAEKSVREAKEILSCLIAAELRGETMTMEQAQRQWGKSSALKVLEKYGYISCRHEVVKVTQKGVKYCVEN